MGIICALRCAVGNQSELQVARAINPVLQGCKSPYYLAPLAIASKASIVSTLQISFFS
jgi:hypothetical protein